MYYRNYEEYMRAVLNYPTQPNYFFDVPYEANENQLLEERNYTIMDNKEWEIFYPEIYHAMNPSVCKVCAKYANEPITKEQIDKMVNEIYEQIDFSNEIMIKINIDEAGNTQRNSSSNSKEENRSPKRPNNSLLRDLIRILILNQLINQRPPRPGRPPRPPYRPDGGRPRNLNYNEYLRF